MPMYPFKIKAQVGLISAHATVGSKAKTSIIFALSRSLFTERVRNETHGSRTKNFWSTVAQKYDRVVDLQIGGTTRSMVQERVMKEERLGEVVEFGCGTGLYTQALVTMADRVTATVIVPGMLAVAKERINTSNVTFQLEDCQATSFPDEAFDM